MMAYGNGMLKEVHFSSRLFAFHLAKQMSIARESTPEGEFPT